MKEPTQNSSFKIGLSEIHTTSLSSKIVEQQRDEALHEFPYLLSYSIIPHVAVTSHFFFPSCWSAGHVSYCTTLPPLDHDRFSLGRTPFMPLCTIPACQHPGAQPHRRRNPPALARTKTQHYFRPELPRPTSCRTNCIGLWRAVPGRASRTTSVKGMTALMATLTVCVGGIAIKGSHLGSWRTSVLIRIILPNARKRLIRRTTWRITSVSQCPEPCCRLIPGDSRHHRLRPRRRQSRPRTDNRQHLRLRARHLPLSRHRPTILQASTLRPRWHQLHQSPER